MKTFSTLAAAIAIILVCSAAQPDGSAQQQPKQEVALSQGELNERALKEFERVDAELAKAFEKALTDEPSPQLREALIAAHRAWRSFREADGHYESVSGEGGSARSQYVNERMTYLTRQRIYQLQTPFAAGWREPTSK